MSVPMRKPRTEPVIVSVKGEKISKVFTLAKSQLKNFLEHLEEVATEKIENSRDWRHAFQQDIQKHSEPGLALRGARLKEGLTQKELAKQINVEQGNIAAMESGKRPIGKQMAKRLGEELKIDYRVFL
jgi:ribosome-binding protein aMBF1 (putative translation factor)